MLCEQVTGAYLALVCSELLTHFCECTKRQDFTTRRIRGKDCSTVQPLQHCCATYEALPNISTNFFRVGLSHIFIVRNNQQRNVAGSTGVFMPSTATLLMLLGFRKYKRDLPYNKLNV